MEIKIKELRLGFSDSVKISIINHPEKFIVINGIGGEINIEDSQSD